MLKYAIPTRILTSLIRQLGIGLLPAMASLEVGFIGILLTMTILGYGYELHHPIAVGEKDLGIGLMVMCWIAFALLLATPLMLWLSCRIYRFITKMLSKRYSH